ncbi:hypothetical protein SEA_LILMARTIN_83 [Streptomyces phage LilMartin]|nr:hypothetical protein SEA_LILMARTIN_83 [Streptomyces phage LilMartin]QNO12507.1 hypothetical protein SEA_MULCHMANSION_83 [Streptomyces phage MulchMansion]UVK61178.1 hypothetical protein SEA_ANGELA_83 [Streptomyces phage Angela]
MANLTRIEYVRRDNGEWLMYKKYDNDSELAGPISREEVEAMIAEMYDE